MSQQEITILRALLENENVFVSGSKLAASLGMTRVGVWQHMEKLRLQGFAFEAIRARGYKISSRPTQLNHSLIAAHLAGRQLPVELLFFDEVDSTNDEAARQLAAGRAAPFVVIARQQTQGRGRFGRSWHSNDGGNLYISFGFRPQIEPVRMQTFTLWMGVNICELIANFTRTTPGLKWPNDILFDGRKAGGMLTEARMDADQIRDLVFGLGLNINSQPSTWPEALARRASSISEQLNTSIDLNKLTAALIGRVHDAYVSFMDGGYQTSLATLWNQYDVLRGKTVSLTQGTKQVTGTSMGIDDEGSLILRVDKSGKTERFRAGEVSLSKSS